MKDMIPLRYHSGNQYLHRKSADYRSADSGPSRTVIPAHRGQHSGDRGQFLMSV
jgi:hypothetical protein